MAEKFDEFMADVEEDIRNERYEHLWKKYGKYVVGFTSAVLISTALYNFWDYRMMRRSLRFAEQLIEGTHMLSEGRTADGMALLKPLEDQGHDAYEVLSLFARAGALHVKNAKEDREQASAIYRRLHGHKNPLFRDLSYVYAGYLRLNDEQDDKACEEIRADLEKIAADSPVRPLADEVLAMTYIRQKQYDKAMPLLTAIVQNPQTGKDLSSRAKLMLQYTNTQAAG